MKLKSIMISLKNLCALFSLLGETSAVYDPAPDKFHLPPLGINADFATVAGFSSGSYMAS